MVILSCIHEEVFFPPFFLYPLPSYFVDYIQGLIVSHPLEVSSSDPRNHKNWIIVNRKEPRELGTVLYLFFIYAAGTETVRNKNHLDLRST